MEDKQQTDINISIDKGLTNEEYNVIWKILTITLEKYIDCDFSIYMRP